MMQIITVCGSVRFRTEMLAYREKEIMNGNWILLPENMEVDIQKVDKRVKDAMDWVHLSKIDHADVVLFWNQDGYMGESTRRELKYAETIGKPIKFLEELDVMGDSSKQIVL